jgi:hypothetical protein
MSRKKGRRHLPAAPPLVSSGCSHRGNAVRVGPYTVLAGGLRYLTAEDFAGADVLVPLTQLKQPVNHPVINLALPDFGGVPVDWRQRLEQLIIPELAAGKTLLAFCFASHGRTGTFLASLIALLESAEETPDPIAAVRQRHCREAVESLAQAQGIFALRGQPVPEQYCNTLYQPKPKEAQ